MTAHSCEHGWRVHYIPGGITHSRAYIPGSLTRAAEPRPTRLRPYRPQVRSRLAALRESLARQHSQILADTAVFAPLDTPRWLRLLSRSSAYCLVLSADC